MGISIYTCIKCFTHSLHCRGSSELLITRILIRGLGVEQIVAGGELKDHASQGPNVSLGASASA